MDSCAYAIAYNVIYKRLENDSVKKEIKKINIVKETKL